MAEIKSLNDCLIIYLKSKMKLAKALFLIIINILFWGNIVYAQTTEEIEQVKLYKSLNTIMCTPYFISNISYAYNDDVIDYAVQIIKYKPDSIAAYLTISGMVGLEIDYKARKKYEEMKLKYGNVLDNYEKDLPEKIILLELMMYCMEGESNISLKELNKINIEKVLKFSSECNDKRYSALADSILFRVGILDEKIKKYEEFKNKYPDHPAIPYVELQRTARYSTNKEYQKCIEETQNLIKKYGNIQNPAGYKMVISCYSLLFDCYFEMNDKNNAELYLKKIEEECSSYIGLYRIRDQIKMIGKNPIDALFENEPDEPDETDEVEVN